MSHATGAAGRQTIADALDGQRILITGATGFVGKVVVEKLLWSVPTIDRLLLLIRPGGGLGALARFERDLLGSPLMARLRAHHGDVWRDWVASKVEVVEGDLGQERLGLDPETYQRLCRQVDRVVGNAATVTFDERLDRSLALNTRGALRTLALARDAGDAPLLHVSTCFVSGTRTGTISEAVSQWAERDAPVLDADGTLAALDAACEELRQAGETADRAWVAAGASVAARFGFHDVYTLTKALAERLLVHERGSVPLAILRPAIIESAVSEPMPGWIEAVRVSDPLLVAYGRGRAEELPGIPDTPLEMIPVDHVANALIAALASLPSREAANAGAGGAPEVAVYQLGSSRNPITLGALMGHARRGFAGTPLRDEAGAPIVVPEARFRDPERYRQKLIADRKSIRRLRRLVPSWLPGWRRSRTRLRWGSAERTLDHLIHLLAVYQPYLRHGARYDDTRTRQLWDQLTPVDQETFPFDIEAVDWPSYIADAHVPGLVRFALHADTGAPVSDAEGAGAAGEARRAERLSRAIALATDARTTFELFAAVAASDPDAVAFQTCRQGSWLRYTYRQALNTTTNVAARLKSQYGIGPGDRVVLWSSGCPEWVLATLAVHRLGAVTVPLDPQWPAQDLVAAARVVDAKLVCAAPALAVAERADRQSDRPAGLEALACPLVTLAAPFVPEPHVPRLPGGEDVRTLVRSDSLASIIFTSGTTVAPKAVPLTHANYLANVRDLIPLMKLTHERLLSVLPIHHVFEQMVGLLVPMAGGSTISYVAEIKPAEISWMMNTTRPTVLVAVPRLLELLHNGIFQNVAAGGPMLQLVFRVLFALSRRRNGATGHELFAKVHRRFGGCLRRIATGGSALDPDLGRSFQLMGFQVAEGYGMTETSPVLTVNPWDGIRFGSVGKPLPGVAVELRPPVDDHAEDGAAGRVGEVDGSADETVGEVWVRGANVMQGYYEHPEATAAVMREGWLNTGDLGYFDADGYLHIAGRTKDVIVTAAGKNVYPEEVEARYRDLPGVAELVVLGMPQERGGEQVTALVVPMDDAGEDAIRSAIGARSRDVPSYQQVAGVEIWRGELPKTTTMKVKRAKLRDAVLAGERGAPAAPVDAAPPQKAPDGRSKARDRPSNTAFETAVIEALARLTRARPDLVHADIRLAELGVDSLTRVELIGELEARFGLRLGDEAVASLDRVGDLFDLGAMLRPSGQGAAPRIR